MADEIDVSQNLAQVEYGEVPQLNVTQIIAQVEATYAPPGIDGNQVLAQVEYVEEVAPTGPTMEQLLRHGAWFGGGVKKPFWWAK